MFLNKLSALSSVAEFQENIENVTVPSEIIVPESFCKLVLYDEILISRVRIWDLSIIIPNLAFLLFLIIRFNRTRLKLRATNSPIFSTFYILVVLNAVISVVRCVVAMTVNAAVPSGSTTDKVLWIVVRFFLFATEMSVLIFGLAFGHLDSRTSIQRVLFVTSFIALAYSCSQGALEIISPDETFLVKSKNYFMFGHGGVLFLFVSSILFSMVYWIVFGLPLTRLRERLALPTKRSFYWYALFLAILNMVEAVGSGLLYYKVPCGLCIVDVTAFIYYTIFTPLVYRTFLAEFFSVVQPGIMFSYKAQVNDPLEDDDEDEVNFPHPLSCSSIKTDSDYLYQNRRIYASTRFDAVSVNPLFVHSLHSPDSLLSYEGSIDNVSGINSYPIGIASHNVK